MNIYPLAARLRQVLPRWAYECVRRPANIVIGSLNQVLTTGHLQSAVRSRPTNTKGEPLPWLSYPAIRILEDMDLRGLKVLEFGSGNSTLYWDRRGAQVHAIETDPDWFKMMQPLVGARTVLEHCVVQDLARLKLRRAHYDIVLVDGPDGGWRYQAARAVLRTGCLSPEALLIVDNTDFPEYRNIVDLFGLTGLRRVDLYGFAPGNPCNQCTSFYFGPDCLVFRKNLPTFRHWL